MGHQEERGAVRDRLALLRLYGVRQRNTQFTKWRAGAVVLTQQASVFSTGVPCGCISYSGCSTAKPAPWLRPGKAREADTGPLVPALVWETWKKILTSGFKYSHFWSLQPIGEWTTKWKISVSPCPAIKFAFQINNKEVFKKWKINI